MMFSSMSVTIVNHGFGPNGELVVVESLERETEWPVVFFIT